MNTNNKMNTDNASYLKSGNPILPMKSFQLISWQVINESDSRLALLVPKTN